MKKKILLITTLISTFCLNADKPVIISDKDPNVVYEVIDDENLFVSLTETLKLIKTNQITKAAIELNKVDLKDNIFLQVKNSRCQKLMKQIRHELKTQLPQFKNIIKTYVQHAKILSDLNNSPKIENDQKSKAADCLSKAINEAKIIQAYSYILSSVFQDGIMQNLNLKEVCLTKVSH